MVISCKDTGLPEFNYAPKDACGQFSVPLEVKLLFVLRVLAGGTKIKDAASMTGFMSNSTGNVFFIFFVLKFSEVFEDIHIRPLDGEELLKSMRTYARLGLPGGLASIDVTDFPWGKVRKDMKNACNGDKGSALLFEVIVTHEKLVLSVGKEFGSVIADKTSVKYSEFVEAMKQKLIAKDIKYKLRTGMGPDDYVELSAIYLISDGGYLQWPEIICGYQYSTDPLKYKFSDWIASVRKDVECLFGILKMRWLQLRNPCDVHSPAVMRAILVTCCILNNMILRCDGLNDLWDDEENWTTLNPGGAAAAADADAPIEEDAVDSYLPVRFDPSTFNPPALADMPPLDYHAAADAACTDFHTLRDLLARHLHFTYQTGNLRWPKMRKHCVEKGVDLNKVVRDLFPGAGDLFIDEA